MRIIKKQEQQKNENLELKQRVFELEQKISELTYEMRQISESVIEVVKKEEMSQGDYTNPCKYTDGIKVEQGKWYYLDDKDLPKEAIKTGYPTGWGDKSFLV